MSDFDRDKSGSRRGINNATCTGSRWVGAIDRSGSDLTVHGQWVDADLLGKLPPVEPGVPELTDQLIDLGLIAPSARALVVMHPSPSLVQFGLGTMEFTAGIPTNLGSRELWEPSW